ncbi:mechanosensitive ion channel family protein, partial [Campylobacter jejuni]|nr:mechanosensitive ion channel family protein [Campylobacter jejuni]
SLCLTIATYPAPLSVNLSNFFHIVYAVLIAWLILRMLDGYGVVLVSKLAQKSGKKEVVNLIIKILYFVIIIIALLYILAQLGFNISAIIASLGIGGLAVALAAKDIIANFFASILLLFDNSFNQGDWVEVSGIEGTVVETGLRKTTIRTFDNCLVFLPNSTIMGANIKNWSKRRMGRHVRMYLGVGYDATPEKLEQCVKDLREFLHTSDLVAHDEDSALKYGDHTTKYRQNLVSINDLEGYKNACYVALSEFADSSINIELYFYIKEIGGKDFREARQSLMLEFMRIIEKNGLTFAFPSRSIYIENLPPLDLQAKAIK